LSVHPFDEFHRHDISVVHAQSLANQILNDFEPVVQITALWRFEKELQPQLKENFTGSLKGSRVVKKREKRCLQRLKLQLPSRFHPLEGFLEMDFVVASLSAQNPPTVPLGVLVIDARRKRQNESPLHFSSPQVSLAPVKRCVQACKCAGVKGFEGVLKSQRQKFVGK
jgi:hypothetical protein